jgi:hypothetical protein
MKTQWLKIAAMLTFCVLIGLGCDHSLRPDFPSGDHIYFSSFESPEDTVGWRGGLEFRNEAPPNGGQQSVFISGGCVFPHAYIELNGIEKDSRLLLRCWGRDLRIGGSVTLQVVDDWYKTIHVLVADSTWKSYQSSDTLFWPANHRLRLSMSSGGFAASAMLVDQIEVIGVD